MVSSISTRQSRPGRTLSRSSTRGFAAAVPDRLAGVRLDRAARSIADIEGRGDPRAAPSTRGAPPPGHRSPAVVGGPGDRVRAGAAPASYPPAPSVRYPADAPALARRSGEATVDLSQAQGGATTDPAHAPSPDTAPGSRESDLGIQAHSRRDRRPGPESLPRHR